MGNEAVGTPTVYAYSDRNYPGMLKVGFTMKDALKRVAAQYPIKTPGGIPWKIELAISSKREDGSFFRDSDVHHRLSLAGHANEGGEWFRCSREDVLRACDEARNATPLPSVQKPMALRFKIDILSALKDAGYSSYRMRKEKLLSESAIQQIRNGEPVSWGCIETLCALLHCQPGDIMEYKEGQEPIKE